MQSPGEGNCLFLPNEYPDSCLHPTACMDINTIQTWLRPYGLAKRLWSKKKLSRGNKTVHLGSLQVSKKKLSGSRSSGSSITSGCLARNLFLVRERERLTFSRQLWCCDVNLPSVFRWSFTHRVPSLCLPL